MKPKIKICGMKHNTAQVAELQPDYLGFIFYEGSPRNFESSIPEITPKIKRVGVFVNASQEFIIKKVKDFGLNVVQLHGEETSEFCLQLKSELKAAGLNVEVPVLSCHTEPACQQGRRSRSAVEVPVLSCHTEPACQQGRRSRSEVEVPVLSCHTERSRSEVEVPVLSEVEVWKVFSIKDTFNFNTLKPYETVVDKYLFDTKGKEKGGNGFTFDWKVLEGYKSTKPFILSGGIGLDEIENLKEILKTELPIYAIDVNSKFETEPGHKDVGMLEKFINNFSHKSE